MKKILVISFLLLASCDGQAPSWPWRPEIWATDSKMQVIVRDEGPELGIIRTSDPQFDDFICMKKEEIRKAVDGFNQVIKKCKVWEQ